MNFRKSLVQSLLWRGLYFVTLLLVNVFLSRYLQASATGSVYFLSNIFSFSMLVASICLEAGITYFASAKSIQANKLLWFSLGCSFAVAGLSAVIVYVYLQFEVKPDLPVAQYYFFGICYITGLFITNCATALFYVQHNFFLPNFLLTVLNLILIALIPWNAVAENMQAAIKVLDIYFLIFLLQGTAIAIAYILKNKSIKNLSVPVGSDIKKLFKYSAVAMAANVIFFLVYRIDYLFVNASPVCTAADLGNYIQVSKLGQMMLIIPQIIASVIFPGTASGVNRKELNDSIMIIARLFSQLYLVVLIIIILFGKTLFIWLFGSTFNTMQLPFIILIPGIFSLSVLSLLSAYFSGKFKVKVNVTGAVLALLVVIAGDYFFVPVYGIIAAAAISTLGYTVNLAYSLYVFYKDYNINLFNFFGWRRDDYRWLKSFVVNRAKDVL